MSNHDFLMFQHYANYILYYATLRERERENEYVYLLFELVHTLQILCVAWTRLNHSSEKKKENHKNMFNHFHTSTLYLCLE